jgi:hypothetical protein
MRLPSFLIIVVTSPWIAASSCPPSTRGPLPPLSVSQGSPFAETSVAVIPTTDGPSSRNYVVAFNAYNPVGLGASPAWSVSTDLGGSWTRQKESDPGFAFGAPAEVDPASFGGWGPDPTVVWTGQPNQVAFVGLANGLDVGIAVSTDGGKHFGRAHIVNDAESGGADEPTAALEPNTKDLWVFWRSLHAQNAWVRRARFDAQGNLQFTSAVIAIRSNPVPVYPAAIAAGTFHGASHVAIAYPDVDDSGTCLPSPASGQSFFNPEPVNYYVAFSPDGGTSWSTIKVAHDDAWPRCVTGSNLISGHNRYNRNRPAIGIIRNFLVALTLSSPTGSLVHVFNVDPYGGPNVSDIGSWPPPDGARHDQFLPALAIARVPDARFVDNVRFGIAVTWHDTRDDGAFGTTGTPDMNTRQVIFGTTAVGTGGFSAGLVSLATGTPTNGQFPWINTSNGTAGASWGDYEGLAADDVTGNFVAAWADNRTGGDTEVWGAVLRPF